MFQHFLVITLSLVLALSCFAESIEGIVTRVSDGDTIWVTSQGKREKIRLDRIDAPESDQAYGQTSRQKLSDRILQKNVKVEFEKRDQYGRILGIVFLDKEDINLWLVKEGAAWHYKFFDKTPAYAEAEAKARAEKMGLWANPNPVNPYEWRRMKRSGKR